MVFGKSRLAAGFSALVLVLFGMTSAGCGSDSGSSSGSKRDKESASAYRAAAKKGNAEAQYNLGLCYSQGEGVKEDRVEAVSWYRLAAEQGHQDARKKLKEMGL